MFSVFLVGNAVNPLVKITLKMICHNPLDLIGNTPLFKLTRLVGDSYANIYAKLEMFNLTGSVKDRSALGMIEAAEREGLLKPDSVIIESTSGNLGISLAAIASYKGYSFICVLDPKVEEEKLRAMKAYGAKIEMVDKPDENGGYQKPRIARVRELLERIPNAVNLDQYNNPHNPESHYQTTGPEIYSDLEGKIDVLIGSVSTGGHLCGTARYLKEKLSKLHVVGVEPEGSVLFGGKYKPYLQQGAGLSFHPRNYDETVIDEKVKVTDLDAFKTTRNFAQKEGVLVGGSSGGVLHVALQIAKRLSSDKNIVAILPDHGDRYLNTVFSRDWLESKGLDVS